MFASLNLRVIALLAIAAVQVSAHPRPAAIRARTGECSTGTMQCCNSIAPAGSDDAAQLAGILPLGFQSLTVPMGANCIPFSFSGAGTAGTCSAQAACCDGVHNDGDFPVGVNCSPFNSGF